MTTDKPVVKIIREDGKPSRCQVRVNDVLVFDGVSNEALLKETSREIFAPYPPELKPFGQPLKFMVSGNEIDFYVTKVEFSSRDGIRFEARDAASVQRTHSIAQGE